MKKPLVMLLAGGGGTRLGPLVKHRAKPAVPFAGRYRIIDFALSNVMHAGLDWVGLLTQYKPLSLMRHVGIGASWNLSGRRRGLRILPPRTGEEASDWYRGTADAIWQNTEFMRQMKPERVLILSGDHIYRMDYRRMLEEHLDKRADLSLAVMEVQPEEVSRFGIVWTSPDGVITRFEEKPKQATSRLASMGVYLFEWSCMETALEEIVRTRLGFDFGYDIMARLLERYRVVAHRFEGYWRDVGTVGSYFQANQDALNPESGLDVWSWEICTQDESGPSDRPPASFGCSARIESSLISPGCRVDGDLHRSIISANVVIGPGARVEEAILMDGVVVGPGAELRRVIVDKGVQIGPQAKLLAGDRSATSNFQYDRCELSGMSVVGKGCRLPAEIQMGSNVVIEPGAVESDFPARVQDGATVIASAGHPPLE